MKFSIRLILIVMLLCATCFWLFVRPELNRRRVNHSLETLTEDFSNLDRDPYGNPTSLRCAFRHSRPYSLETTKIDLSKTHALHQLETLILCQCKFDSLRPLQRLGKLKTLVIEYCEFSASDEIEMPQIENFQFDGPQDCSKLPSFPNLEELTIGVHRSEIITSLNPGEPYIPDRFDFQKIKKFHHVRKLSLIQEAVNGVGDLSNFESLESIDLSKAYVVSISGIETIPNLKVLNVRSGWQFIDSRFQPSADQIQSIAKCKELQKLVLDEQTPESVVNQIHDLMPNCEIER